MLVFRQHKAENGQEDWMATSEVVRRAARNAAINRVIETVLPFMGAACFVLLWFALP